MIFGKKGQIFQIRPPQKIFRGVMLKTHEIVIVRVGVVRYVPRGYILLLENNFSGRPLTFCGTFENYVKIDPQQ